MYAPRTHRCPSGKTRAGLAKSITEKGEREGREGESERMREREREREREEERGEIE